MIIHYNHDKPVSVYVVNSRLPVYRAYYGDGFGSTIAGLFTRMAPKVAPLAKQLSMKAFDVIRDKGISAVGNLAGKAFTAAKDKITSLVRRKKQPVVLPSTTVMPAKISKAINSAVEEKLASLAAAPSAAVPAAANPLDTQSNVIANMIAGSGFKPRHRRL
jgi:hypothetical protein